MTKTVFAVTTVNIDEMNIGIMLDSCDVFEKLQEAQESAQDITCDLEPLEWSSIIPGIWNAQYGNFYFRIREITL